jgi:site-specific DNA-cytosine methylase
MPKSKTCFLSLFSGQGGFDLAAHRAGLRFDGHFFSEVDGYAAGLFQKRFPEAVPLGDARSIDYGKLPKGEWVVTGGFPCQPHSVAGKREAAQDKRDLWPECARMLRELRPGLALFENVAGLLSSDRGLFFNRVLSDISASGYDAEWQIISAFDVGAQHLRKRVWIVVYPCGGGLDRIARRRAGPEPSDRHLQLETRNSDRNTDGFSKQEKREVCGRENPDSCGICSNVADTEGKGLPERGQPGRAQGAAEEKSGLVPGFERCSETMADTACQRWGERQSEAGKPPSRSSKTVSDTYIIDGDNSGHGTGQIRGERSPEAEISRSDSDTDGKRCQEFPDRITERAGDTDSPSCRNGIGNYWAVEPGVGRSVNGFSARLDEFGGLSDEAKERAREILFDVWGKDGEEAIQWTLGRFDGVSEAEVLLIVMCEYEAERNRIGREAARETVKKIGLRNLWHYIESSRSPHRRKYYEQYAGEYSNALYSLPRKTSSLFPQAWKDDTWENGIDRVIRGEKYRVDRLKCLGNAIVPQCAELIFMLPGFDKWRLGG